MIVGAAWWGLLALVAGPAPEPPRPATWELKWLAPPACPSEAAIREQVAALVPSHVGGEGVMHVDAHVEARDGGYTLTLRTAFLDRHDEREVHAAACEELGEAVALVIAISLDPSLGLSQSEVPEPRVDPADPAPRSDPNRSRSAATPAGVDDRASIEPVAVEPTPARRDDAPSRRRRTVRPPDASLLRLGPQLEIGSLPPFGGGIDLAAGLLWPWVRLEIHGAWSWPRRASGPRSSGGVFQLGLAGVRGCARPRAGRVELPVCAGLDAGAVRVDSVNLDPARTVHAPWLAPNLGVGLAVGGARVGFFTLLEASVAAVRPRILVSDEAIFRSSIVSGRWLAGLELRFVARSGS